MELLIKHDQSKLCLINKLLSDGAGGWLIEGLSDELRMHCFWVVGSRLICNDSVAVSQSPFLKETWMHSLINRPLTISVFAMGFLGACASAPPVNSLATVAVQATVTPGDLLATHSHAIRVRTALQAAGIGAEVISAGRVVRVACATMSDGTWGGLGVLP